MQRGSKTHLVRMGLIVLAVVLLVIIGRKVFRPSTFGLYGHYRASSIEEEVNRPIVHGTDASCRQCHEWDFALHEKGKHKVVSCEFCHGPYGKHVKDGKVVAHLEVKKGAEINVLCLRCHDRAVRSRPKDAKVIKTVLYPEHLEKQNVEIDHLCNQCHLAHAPLEYINRAKKMFPMLKEVSDVQ